MTILQLPFSIDWNSLLTGVIGGLVAALIVAVLVLIAEYKIRKLEKQQDKTERDIVHFKNQTRKITGSVFNFLAPGASIELMKEDLGPPNKRSMSNPELFYENETEHHESEAPTEEALLFHSYLYFFKNAHVKVLSKDNETIDVLTVLGWDKDISLESLPVDLGQQNYNLNEAKVTKEILDCFNIHAEHFPGCRDSFTVLRTYIGNPFWTYITYFVDAYEIDQDPYDLNLQDKPELLLGATITGVCLTNEERYPSYIYLSELPIHG